jgi:hypothetical protein
VFAGTFGALAIMTGISVGIGQVFHVADESLSIFQGGVPWDDYLAVALLLFFGGVGQLENSVYPRPYTLHPKP